MNPTQAYMHEPGPVLQDTQPVWELVVKDMIARDHEGRKKYGTPLQHFNGRNAAMDAYQESLDQTVYLRQLVDELNVYIRLADACRGIMSVQTIEDGRPFYKTIMECLQEIGK